MHTCILIVQQYAFNMHAARKQLCMHASKMDSVSAYVGFRGLSSAGCAVHELSLRCMNYFCLR